MKPYWVFVCAAAWVLGGCTKEAQSDYGQAGSDVQQAAQKTGDAISSDAHEAAPKIKAEADQAGATLKRASDQAQKNAAQALMTGKVKEALMSAAGLQSKNIEVETTEKTITVTGSVPSSDQKKQAHEIVAGIAGSEYSVDDQLRVAPSP